MAATRDDTPDPPHGAAPRSRPGFEPAGLGRRLGALIVDWLLSVLLSAAFADPRSSGWPPVAILILQHAVFVGYFGQTPGMMFTRIRCISFADGGAIGVLRALLRGILLALVLPPVIMDDLRRGLHDKAAGSIVVALPPRTTV